MKNKKVLKKLEAISFNIMYTHPRDADAIDELIDNLKGKPWPRPKWTDKMKWEEYIEQELKEAQSLLNYPHLKSDIDEAKRNILKEKIEVLQSLKEYLG